MKIGSKPVYWQAARVLVRWWVKRLIRQHVAWVKKTEYSRSNMNYAKMQLTIARIEYWRQAFKARGTWNIGGYQNFSFIGHIQEDCYKPMNTEMAEMGFNQTLEWPERGE